jgi:hypothetical protein
MLLIRFYRIENDEPYSVPIRTLRKNFAFINPAMKEAVIFPVFKAIKHSGAPIAKLWNGFVLRELRFLTYPNIKENEWFTFEKTGTDRVRKVSLREFHARIGKPEDD